MLWMMAGRVGSIISLLLMKIQILSLIPVCIYCWAFRKGTTETVKSVIQQGHE